MDTVQTKLFKGYALDTYNSLNMTMPGSCVRRHRCLEELLRSFPSVHAPGSILRGSQETFSLIAAGRTSARQSQPHNSFASALSKRVRSPDRLLMSVSVCALQGSGR